MKTMQRLWRDDSGTTAIEYGLLASIVAVGIVTALGTLKGDLVTTFQTVAAAL